ncbi:MAG: hypothetical protein M3Z64_10875 [Verrucomicrobiota bacterium]|nr:hypothetical protein [Verrucomicrobiota bacterium]
MNDANATNDPNKNPDPITGEPGSHPLGTGLGTAGAGVAGAAIGGAVGGPIGAAIGAVVGGIAGAAGGHGVAEAINPTQEEAYWRENHSSQPYADQEFSYQHYAPAYRTGYEGVTKYAGKTYDQIETDLALDYQKADPNSALPWDRARPAVRAAWDRVSGVVTPRDTDRGTRSGL